MVFRKMLLFSSVDNAPKGWKWVVAVRSLWWTGLKSGDGLLSEGKCLRITMAPAWHRLSKNQELTATGTTYKSPHCLNGG